MSEAMRTLRAEPLRRFKSFPAYMDSGVEWLGEIPAHWLVMRLGFNATFLVPMRDKPEDLRGDVPWVRIEDFEGRRISGSKSGQGVSARTIREMNLKVFPVGTVLCSCSCNMGATAIVNRPLVSNQTFIGIVPCERLASEYVYYLMQVAKQHLTALATGAIQQYLSQNDFSSLRMPLLPLLEQRAIAAFLDRETARIDALVAKKERLIKLLQEKRTALITRAVTKGLDPTVPMKDSGVEWLGDIPAHWDVERIKWAAQMVSGHTPDKKVDSYWQGGDIPWVSLADTSQLREVDYIATTAVMTTSAGIANSSAHVLPDGTVVFSRDATIGLCAITRGGLAVSQHFIGWVCGSRLRPEYLLFVLRSMTQHLERLTMGATVRTIGMPDVKSLVTPIPPLDEQDRIVREVLSARTRIDALIAKVRDAIDRLKELRAALISAAVTGKIDVREEAS